MPLNVVVTGANAGLGLELCKQLTARGDVVYASCRAPTAELEAVGVKKVRTFFTRPSVSTFDRIPFQLTDE